MRPLLRALCALPFASCAAPSPVPPAPPDPENWTAPGPGLGGLEIGPDELFERCAILDGGEADPTLDQDDDHHNLVALVDGYLVMPFAPEWSNGGVAFFDVSDPCAPVKIAERYGEQLRESHTLAFARKGGRLYGAFDHHEGVVAGELLGGIEIWDLTDPATAAPIAHLDLPGYAYPDAYARVTLSTFWAGNTLWVSGADNGLYAIDVRDPSAPELIATHIVEPPMRVGAVHVVGGVGMASTAEGSRVVLFDASDPAIWRPLAGGDFHVRDELGVDKEYYFANLVGSRALFARKEDGGGPVLYDLRDPHIPARVGAAFTEGGNGGYVFANKDTIFVGDSHWGAVFDFSDPNQPTEIGRAIIPGDLDTNTPIGQFMVLAVDEDSVADEASAIVPWSALPDAAPPEVAWSWPAEDGLPVEPFATIALSFDENIEFASVHPGSVRIHDDGGWPVAGTFSLVDTILSFAPDEPWPAGEIHLSVPPGGVADVTGNPIVTPFERQFTAEGD